MNEHQTTFIKVSLKNDPRIHSLKLPVTLGGNDICDIVLRSHESAAPEFTINMLQGKLVAYYKKNGTAVDLQLFERMGIIIDGPFFETPSPIKKLPKHKIFFQKKRRFVIMLGICLVLAVTGILLTLRRHLHRAPQDLSHVPITLTEGMQKHKPRGYTPKISGNQSAIHFQWFRKTPNVPYVFSFLAGSLDLNQEILLTINSHIIYSYSLDINCIDSFCPLEIMIPSELLLPKEINILSVLHRQKDSFYLIKDVLLTPMLPASDDELTEIYRRIELSRRYFEDRHISSINLLSAQSQILRALELVGKRQLGSNLRMEVRGLARDIQYQLQDVVQRLEDEMMNKIKLQLHQEAIKNGEQLVKIYGESDYKKRNRVMSLIEQLKLKKI